MKRFAAIAVAACGLVVICGAVAAPSPAARATSSQTTCSSGYVVAVVGGQPKCLRAGEFCSPREEADYERYGFTCVDGRLRSGAPATSTTTTTTEPTVTSNAGIPLGVTVTIGSRTQTGGCKRGALPDRRCSPGAYFAGLDTALICASNFHTSAIRRVPQSEKYAVETEYGMTARLYGRTIEIDHIVPLELGGSNDIANLFPEPGSGAANYRLKDKLENRLHALVCSGQLTLAAARDGIARNWESLYTHVFGIAP